MNDSHFTSVVPLAYSSNFLPKKGMSDECNVDHASSPRHAFWTVVLVCKDRRAQYLHTFDGGYWGTIFLHFGIRSKVKHGSDPESPHLLNACYI